ncbi:MAG: UDP-glucose 4-epimerase GalE [Thermoanaerobaculia bacterium]
MRVLVTGGAGYIGSITTRQLLDAGHEVTVFDNLENGHLEAVDRRADFVRGDLRASGDIERAIREARPEAVVHFAAYAYVGESMADPVGYYGNNVGGAIALLEAMTKADVRRIVFSSSCATYGDPERSPIVEDTAKRPTNPYGETKLAVERLLGWLRQTQGLEPVLLRYFNAAGASGDLGEDHDPETHLIPLALSVALGQRESLQLFGDDYDTPDGTCVRDYVHVDDLARAHVMALSSERLGAFNLGTGRGHSVREVVETAVAVSQTRISTEIKPRRMGDPAILIADPAKANRLLGWEARSPDLQTIIADAWQWHSRFPQGYASAPGVDWRAP